VCFQNSSTKTLVEKVVESLGALVLWTPRFHPEFQLIECCYRDIARQIRKTNVPRVSAGKRFTQNWKSEILIEWNCFGIWVDMVEIREGDRRVGLRRRGVVVETWFLQCQSPLLINLNWEVIKDFLKVKGDWDLKKASPSNQGSFGAFTLFGLDSEFHGDVHGTPTVLKRDPRCNFFGKHCNYRPFSWPVVNNKHVNTNMHTGLSLPRSDGDSA
jgi:hypothetical protein